jgi:hypothetical protein
MDYEGYKQLRQPFVGVWTLVRTEFLNYENQPLYPFGGDDRDKPPFGRLIYTDHNLFSAHMSASLHQRDRPGVPYYGYTGTYVVDGNRVHHLTDCLSANFQILPPEGVSKLLTTTREYKFTPEGHLILTASKRKPPEVTQLEVHETEDLLGLSFSVPGVFNESEPPGEPEKDPYTWVTASLEWKPEPEPDIPLPGKVDLEQFQEFLRGCKPAHDVAF